ncbi:MAG: hypothetical protein J3K34DRAFT_262235 [Monoraphidium minutum]|nr:MAG: hypothetical protein J3K34DRAFT_262235 [Monoraphidium minutum]
MRSANMGVVMALAREGGGGGGQPPGWWAFLSVFFVEQQRIGLPSERSCPSSAERAALHASHARSEGLIGRRGGRGRRRRRAKQGGRRAPTPSLHQRARLRPRPAAGGALAPSVGAGRLQGRNTRRCAATDCGGKGRWGGSGSARSHGFIPSPHGG